MPNFQCQATLHRFVRARDAEAAKRIAHLGMQLASSPIKEPHAVVEAIEIESIDASPYSHEGEVEDLWQVSIAVYSRLNTFDSHSASEAAHQLITVDDDAASSDAFEFEIEVGDEPRAA